MAKVSVKTANDVLKLYDLKIVKDARKYYIMRPTCMVESPITFEKRIDFTREMSRIQPLSMRQQTVEHILLDILKNLEYYNHKLYIQAL